MDKPEKFERDEYMEAISERIRRGHPVSAMEAIAAIQYQHELRQYRAANSTLGRIKRWLSPTTKPVK